MAPTTNWKKIRQNLVFHASELVLTLSTAKFHSSKNQRAIQPMISPKLVFSLSFWTDILITKYFSHPNDIHENHESGFWAKNLFNNWWNIWKRSRGSLLIQNAKHGINVKVLSPPKSFEHAFWMNYTLSPYSFERCSNYSSFYIYFLFFYSSFPGIRNIRLQISFIVELFYHTALGNH